MKNGKKRRVGRVILIVVLVAALLAGGTFGALKLADRRGGEVNVYPVSAFATGAEGMDRAETEGFVTTDRIQTVYLSSTQEVTEIFVEEGQEVKAGDTLLAFDTTLSELELHRQGIRVEQLGLDISNAEKELRQIDTYRVGSPPVYTPTYTVPTYTAVPYMPYDRAPEALGTLSDPLVWLWNDDCILNEAFFLRVAALAAAHREAARENGSDEPETPIDEPTEPTPAPEEPTADPEETPAVPEEPTSPPEEPTSPPEEPTSPPEEPTSPPEEPAPEPEEPEPDPEEPEGEESAAAPMPGTRLLAPVMSAHIRLRAPEQPGYASDEMSELDDPAVYIVFEVRSGDSEAGPVERVWEMALTISEDGDWYARFLAPMYDPGEESGWWDDGMDDYPIDTNVYYSAEEIARMKSDVNKRLRDLQIQLKAAELEYERLEYELTNGEVVSRIDGVVKTVRDPEEARADNKALILVSGGGGYYVTAALGEFDRGAMQVGDTVTIQSWENYQTMEGTITEISEYPDENNQYWYYSQGNQNTSHYPFKVFVDESAELRENSYVSVTWSNSSADGGGLYLESPFIRTEGGRSYVYTVGPDGLLQKRYILTGKSLWGSYVEILGGLSWEDCVAFPYGRKTVEGARVRYAEPDELWSSVYGIG